MVIGFGHFASYSERLRRRIDFESVKQVRIDWPSSGHVTALRRNHDIGAFTEFEAERAERGLVKTRPFSSAAVIQTYAAITHDWNILDEVFLD